MKNLYITILIIVFGLFGETLFEIKDSNNDPVFVVNTDGILIINQDSTAMGGKALGDTLMIISASEIRANLDNGLNKALSRSFAVTTSATGKVGERVDVLEINTGSSKMREGQFGNDYTDFSPQNIFIGLNAGAEDGMASVYVGNNAGSAAPGGERNVFIGNMAGANAENVISSVFIGEEAGLDANYGGGLTEYNVAIGQYAGQSFVGGYNNVMLGAASGMLLDGNSNCLLGNEAGKNIAGNSNVIVGSQSAKNKTSGNYNVIIGKLAGNESAAGESNVFLGYKAGYYETGSNKLYIENSESSSPLIWGDFNSDLLKFNGNVGVNASPSTSYGLYAFDDFEALRGIATTSSGTYTYGVYGDGNGGSTRNVSIYGSSPSGTGSNYAGYFSGDINVTGTVYKSMANLKIDHPSDPENKYLVLSDISSDQRTNIYHGNVILDDNGSAIVELPDWVESMNNDFRYVLTPIGGAAPDLHIAEEISESKFKISGGKSGMKVSWEVKGIRNDNYSKMNPLNNEVDKKGIEIGHYIHPEAFGKNAAESIDQLHLKASEKSIDD